MAAAEIGARPHPFDGPRRFLHRAAITADQTLNSARAILRRGSAIEHTVEHALSETVSHAADVIGPAEKAAGTMMHAVSEASHDRFSYLRLPKKDHKPDAFSQLIVDFLAADHEHPAVRGEIETATSTPNGNVLIIDGSGNVIIHDFVVVKDEDVAPYLRARKKEQIVDVTYAHDPRKQMEAVADASPGRHRFPGEASTVNSSPSTEVA